MLYTLLVSIVLADDSVATGKVDIDPMPLAKCEALAEHWIERGI